MANLTMDLTGADSTYAESGQVFRIYKYGQYIDFGTTVFKSSLKVYLISGGISTPVELVLNADYQIPESFINSCDNDTSSAKLIDPTFDKELISGIQMIRGVNLGTTYTVSISYQRLYPKQLTTAYVHGVPLEVTPELIYDMISSIEQLKRLTTDVSDVGSLTTGNNLYFEQDESYSNPNNYVTDEEHWINVSGGRFMIHPKGGSFYRDSVKITYPATGVTLQEGVDYVITGMDEGKTKVTSSVVPVYNFILFITQITGYVNVTYHTFGGDPTIDNYRALLTNMNNVVRYLNDVEFITSTNLGQTTAMTSVFQRIDQLEDNVRRLQGTPAYGDITSGKCILMKLFSETQGLHWYTIASLYTVAGKTVPCTADTFTFRFQSELSHIQFTASVTVDQYNNKGDRMNVAVHSDNYPRGYVPFTDYTGVDKIIRPQLRIVWNNSKTVSGMYLQLGFELKNMMEETVSIEDMSGHESCWKLVEETAKNTLPQDDNILLPSGNATWSTLLPESQSESTLIPYKNGHLVWSGDYRLNTTSGWQVFEPEHYLNTNVDISRIHTLRLDIEEIQGYQFPIDIKFNAYGESRKGHASFTYANQPAYINAEMYREDNKIVIRINYDILAGNDNNILSLRDMVVYL